MSAIEKAIHHKEQDKPIDINHLTLSHRMKMLKVLKRVRKDSNPQPPDLKSGVYPIELRTQNSINV